MGAIGMGGAALLGAPLFIVIFALSLLLYPTGVSPIPATSVFSGLGDLLSTDILIPIPLFTIAGFILAESRAPQRVLRLARALFGWLPGGVAIVSILILAGFTAFTGASGVTIIALGGLMWPIMSKQGYPEQFSLGVLTSSGSIGLLLFPSLPVFVYVTVAAMNKAPVDAGALFAAGALPCFLMIGILMLYAAYTGVRIQAERTPWVWSEVIAATKGAIGELGLPVAVIALLVTGEIALEEVAICTFLYLFVVEVLIYRDIDLFRTFPKVVVDAMSLVGAIVVILVAVAAINNYFIDAEIPQKLVAWIQTIIPADEPVLFLIALNVFLLLVGCMMDIFSAMIAVLPLILPLAEQYGIHPLHLGVIFLANLEVGYITPPVGMNLFISALHFKKPIMSVARSVIPFMALLMIALTTITYYEPLSRWLPQQLGHIETTSREADRAAKIIDTTIRLGREATGGVEAKKAADKHEQALDSESVDDYIDEDKEGQDLRCDDKNPCPKGQVCETGVCISLDDLDDL